MFISLIITNFISPKIKVFNALMDIQGSLRNQIGFSVIVFSSRFLGYWVGFLATGPSLD